MSARGRKVVAELEAHLAIAEQLIEEASLYLWDVVIELDLVSPHDADALASRVLGCMAESLQLQLDDLARYVLEPEPGEEGHEMDPEGATWKLGPRPATLIRYLSP